METKCTRMLVLFLGYVVFLVAIPSASQPQAARQLLRFRDSLPESSKSLLQWNQTTSASAHCSWDGVECYSETDFRVKSLKLEKFYLSGILEDSFSYLCQLPDLTILHLTNTNFTGNVPAELGNCSQLNDIFLFNNSLSGPIPPHIFKPGRLLGLDLGSNQLSGTIPPEVGQCKSLQYLALDNNLLNGEIPSELFSIANLSKVYLMNNNLTGALPELPSPCLLSQFRIPRNSFHGPLPLSLSNCHDLQFLDVSDNNLGGILQQNIFQNLTQLTHLYLDGNDFEGQVPMSLWSLRNLTTLILGGNRFNGSLPEDIGRCDQLTHLNLSGNILTGLIPNSVSYLRNLKVLYLNKNKLSGPLPPGIGNCSSLVEVEITSNNITGILPPEICSLRSLETLFLDENQIEGPIPHCIESLISLRVLTIFGNRLTGRIPSGIRKLTNLIDLVLAQNKLTGEIPSDLGKNNVPGLIKLDLTGNHLTGEIPSTLCSGNRLLRLTLGDNQFTGSFPAEFIKCKPLHRFFLYNNRLQGSMPIDMGISSSISEFNIRGNLFEGTIPTVIGSWSNLSLFDLSGNQFSGTIPQEFGKLQKLVRLRMSSNRLTGEIPPELSLCPRITELDLSKNELEGGVPSEIISSSTLAIIRLQDNKLNGVIPDSFVSSHLYEVQLGNNLLKGSFPCSLGSLQNFNYLLNLSMNQFSGEIPRCIGKLAYLPTLDISSNSFSGTIPSEVNNMKALSFLNISHNQFSGQIPVVWANVLEKHPGTYLGNPRLCSVSTKTGNCGGHKKALSRGILAGIITGSLFLTACLIAAIYALVTRVWHHTPSSPHQALLYSRSSNEDLPEDLNFLDILRGTEGWSDKHVIGRGKHGTVYRAQSVKSKKHWAVKRVDLTEANFNSEMRILNLVRHRNILRMGGYSIRNGYGYIVTEYMPEGTLYHLLHQRRPRVALNWEQRYRIAFGIAQGLSYLHHDCVPQIIHRDIKSDNVLLDSEFEPKIGDFGAAKLDSEVDENQTASAIIGTLGYIAPGKHQLVLHCRYLCYNIVDSKSVFI